MQDKQVIESLKTLIKALGIKQEELFPTYSQRIIEEEEDDDISLLTGAASSHLVRKQVAPSTPTNNKPVSTSAGILEELKNVRSWDVGAYGGKISQVMKDGETPNFEESTDSSTPNSVDTFVDASLIDDDDDNFGGLK